MLKIEGDEALLCKFGIYSGATSVIVAEPAISIWFRQKLGSVNV